MADILVHPYQLRIAAQNLRRSAQHIQHSIEQTDQQLGALGSSYFQGYQADRLRARYQRQRDRLSGWARVVVNFAEALEKIAQTFETADKSITGGLPPTLDVIGEAIRIELNSKMRHGWPLRWEIYCCFAPCPSRIWPARKFWPPRFHWPPLIKLPRWPILPGFPLPIILPEISRWPLPKLPWLPQGPEIPLWPVEILPPWLSPRPEEPPFQPLPVPIEPEPTEQGNTPFGTDGSGGSVPPQGQDDYPPVPENINRSYATIKKLDVEHNGDYVRNHQGKNETYCNIFTMDYAKEMSAPLPEHLDWNQDGKIDRYLDANKATAWLRGTFNEGGEAVQQGPDLGWKKMDADQAAELAGKGYVVVAGWENPGGIGHMAVVRPESTPGDIRIAQAGGKNFVDGPISDGFGQRVVEYFVYAPKVSKS